MKTIKMNKVVAATIAALALGSGSAYAASGTSFAAPATVASTSPRCTASRVDVEVLVGLRGAMQHVVLAERAVVEPVPQRRSDFWLAEHGARIDRNVAPEGYRHLGNPLVLRESVDDCQRRDLGSGLERSECGVVDDDAVEKSVELFVVDAVGALHFAIQAGRAGFDVDVTDAFVQDVVVER